MFFRKIDRVNHAPVPVYFVVGQFEASTLDAGVLVEADLLSVGPGARFSEVEAVAKDRPNTVLERAIRVDCDAWKRSSAYVYHWGGLD